MRSSSSIPVWLKSNGFCFKTELQKPCWRVAVRRCLEFSRAQQRRAEPLLGFRSIRPSFARLFLVIRIVVWSKVAPLCVRLANNPQRLKPNKPQTFNLQILQGGDRFVNDERFKIFSGTANPVLAKAICKHLDVPLGEAKLGRFSDGEIYFQILENV